MACGKKREKGCRVRLNEGGREKGYRVRLNEGGERERLQG